MKNKAYEAFWWLNDNHERWPIRSLDVDMAKVNPKTGRIDDDEAKNTRVDYWLEGGPFGKKHEAYMHDPNLDCGGETFEEAIVKYAELVKKHYGNRSDIYGETL